MSSLRVALAQINVTVGDLRGNRDKVLASMREARKAGAGLVLFPELTLTGYPPEDLLFKESFVRENLRMLRSLEPASRGLTAVVGFVEEDAKGHIYNAAAVLSNGRRVAVYRKVKLPNYGVFDEKRYFEPGSKGLILECDGIRIGVSICEDMWLKDSFVYRAPYKGGLSLLLNLSASPYHWGKQKKTRIKLIQSLARAIQAPVVYNNLVGGQDELVFDGGGLVADAQGRILAAAPLLEEKTLIVDLPLQRVTATSRDAEAAFVPVRLKLSSKKRQTLSKAKELTPESEVYAALVLGTRDYIRKNGFKKVLIGLSGGIDSALVARIAVDALGPANVIGVTMPSRFTSSETLEDSWELAKRLGIECLEIPIEKAHSAHLELLRGPFAGQPENIAEENLQARIRGNLLMALSNKFGHLVLTTGNKSEMATGYCTLYGDMAGGFAPLKDVPKTWVFRLSRYRNRLSPKNSIPERILKRPPTAELRHGQKDQDTLPPYPVLDAMIEKYVENDRSAESLLNAGYGRALVKKVVSMIDRNEYKRRQSPPGIKITSKAFGRDRRMPITNRYGL